MDVRKLLLSVCVMLSLGAWNVQAQTADTSARYPKREFRGAWIQVVNGQFKGLPGEQVRQLLIDQLNSLHAAGFNAIIFQVRPEADALYDSKYEPFSRFLTGVQGQRPWPFWDPMQFMIEECHKRGMEFHAWINPYRVKTTLKSELAPEHVYYSHPEWFVTYGDQLYFDPALPESRDYICKVITDIVSRYDVDAIHMDDYFYPYPIAGKEFPDDASFARYGKAAGFKSRADWRRNNVNLLIERIHETIRALKPWVKFGISPFGIYRNASRDPLGSQTNGLQNYDDLYADVLLWLRKGWVDYNMPQIYWQIGHPAADYATLVEWWAKNSENRPLFIGQSVTNTVQNADPQNPSINQLPRKMALQRSYQTIGGSCQWYAGAVVENVGRYRDALIGEYYKYPALPPVFEFMDNKAPGKVRKLKALWTDGGYFLFWTAPKYKEEMDRPDMFVIYRFPAKERVNLDNPARIVAFTRDPYFKLPYEKGKVKWRYVVTALDRMHNESDAVGKKVKL
ncbi:MAG: family 10 glycosylhydrolase [Prevotellaceae bacterium]|nr:family 10 glycosylhydrolase [Prevotellaceae bacterium]